MNGSKQLMTMEAKKVAATALIRKASQNATRLWSKGWKKPKLNKAGKCYQEAAYLYCQAKETEEAKLALLKSFECFKAKRQWYNAAKVLEEVIKLDIETRNLAVILKIRPSFF